jgi:hypothetical protein
MSIVNSSSEWYLVEKLPIEARLMRRVIKEPGGCWIWQGALSQGYGWMWTGVRLNRTHRVAYELFRGEIPAGKFVCHHCDVRRCVNPEHLFLGTNAENIADARRKGRLVPPKGRKRSKKMHKRDREIIRRYKGGATLEQVGEAFELSRAGVAKILEGHGVKRRRRGKPLKMAGEWLKQ